jgi:hypothetical protein
MKTLSTITLSGAHCTSIPLWFISVAEMHTVENQGGGSNFFFIPGVGDLCFLDKILGVYHFISFLLIRV